MFNPIDQTIVAPATPTGQGAVAVLRLSGPDSWHIAKQLMQHPDRLKEANQVVVDWVADPGDKQALDRVVLLPFKAPSSFTGQDVVEIQCHGGPAIVQLLLKHCTALGANPAQAGEFSQRAVVNGRLDLTQAESVLDLIHAQGEALVKLSAHNLQHQALGQLLTQLFKAISDVQADMVASIDFPDEVDEPDRGGLAQRLKATYETLQAQLEQHQAHQYIRDGLRVALVGAPNAGKSSLFNALLQTDRAIVTDVPGTTRDTLEATLTIGGVPVVLVDTAGLRETQDTVEKLGVMRSQAALDTAQLIVVVVDQSAPLPNYTRNLLNPAMLEPDITAVVLNKADTPRHQDITVPEGYTTLSTAVPSAHLVAADGASAQSGLDDLLAWLTEKVGKQPSVSQMGYLLSVRQLGALEQVSAELHDSIEALNQPQLPLDLVTVPLTNALLGIEGLLGKDTSEAVLDVVFSRFCVGK